jgi:hypothetical protein
MKRSLSWNVLLFQHFVQKRVDEFFLFSCILDEKTGNPNKKVANLSKQNKKTKKSQIETKN